MEAADEFVVDFVLEEIFAGVVDAGPAPHVFVVAVISRGLEDCGADAPHYDCEDEDGDGEDGEVDCCFFGAFVASSPVVEEDDGAHCKGYTGDDEKHNLWPGLLSYCPWRKTVSWRKRFGCVEDCEC